MTGFNPLNAVGMVLGQVSEEPLNLAFLGTCFSLRDTATVTTAAHCVGDLDPSRLYVQMPRIALPDDLGKEREIAIGVAEVIKHPNADLAILRLKVNLHAIEPFWNVGAVHGLGDDLCAYGYPEDVRTEDREPTARLFKGYVQRIFLHKSMVLPFVYPALELDFGCPAGLSPLFRAAAAPLVLGIATENFESTTFLDALEEKDVGGKVTRTRYQRVLSYGVAVHAADVTEWLDAHLPPFDRTAWEHRQPPPPAG